MRNHSLARQRWVILGAGMLGLTLAWRLAQRGLDVIVLEAAGSLGGLTAGFTHGAVQWDRYYHVIESSDRELLALLDELGLERAVEWRQTRTLFFDGSAHHPLNDAFDYLRLPALSLVDKLRIGLNIVYGARRGGDLALERLSAEDWLCAWSGRSAFEALWRPLLRAKLGANYSQVSAAYIGAVMRRFYGAREGASRTEKFGFVSGGYTRIVAALADRLRSAGVQVVTGAAVHAIARSGQGLAVGLLDRKIDCDAAVLTFASPRAVELCPELGPDERARHAQLRYQGVVCLSLLLRRPLGGAYLTYITDETIPFTTVIEMSALTGTAACGGLHLVYLPKYVPSDDALLQADDGSIVTAFCAGLERLYPDFKAPDVVEFRVARASHVMALPTLDYSRHLPPMRTDVAGLSICNSAHIVNASLAVNETILLANRAATTLTQP